MNIPINKDFERDYKDNAWRGFSLHELKYLAAGVCVAVILCLVLWRCVGLSVTAAIYIGIPGGCPLILAGFWRAENGLDLKGCYAASKYRKATAKLSYRAGEYQEYIPKERNFAVSPVSRRKKRSYRKFIKQLQKGEKIEFKQK